MFRIHMNDIVITNPQYITRTATQDMLHHALSTDENQTCFGLLGSSNESIVQQVFTVRDVALLNQVLSDWKAKGLTCMGLYHLEHVDAPDFIHELQDDSYTELSVNLDELGRLDLLAFQVSKSLKNKQKISLDLIEDGHSETDE